MSPRVALLVLTTGLTAGTIAWLVLPALPVAYAIWRGFALRHEQQREPTLTVVEPRP